MFNIFRWIGVLALISLIWTIPLKGLALWFSARRDHKIWFVALLIIHTLGFLELFYLLLYGLTEKVETTKPKAKRKTRKKSKRKTKK